MNWRETLTRDLGLKLLSLFLAACLWLFVMSNREGESTLSLPVLFANLPPGLAIADTPASRLDVRVTGPRILLFKLEARPLPVTLDLADARPGSIVFPAMASRVPVPEGVRVTRVAPAEVEVQLVMKKRE